MIHKVTSLSLFAMAVAACTVPTATHEDTFTQTEAYIANLGAIQNRGLCMDVFSFNQRSGDQTIDLWDCNGLINQQWSFNTVTHEVTSKYNGKCLDNLSFDNVSVGMWDCNGLPNQRWWPNGNGELVNERDGKCLRTQWWTHSPGNSHGSGTAVFLAGCQDPEWQTYSVFGWNWWAL